MTGAEPYSVEGGPTGVLVLHGFTGNPQSMRSLAERLAADGHTVDLPLLPGHGTAVEDMALTGWEDWSGAAEAAYRALASRCERVAVTGLSMGGALACALAAAHPEVAGIAVVNPIVAAPGDELRGPIRDLLAAGETFIDGIGSDIAKEGAVEASYGRTPLACVLSLFEGVDALGERLGAIRCPVLLLTSREDHVVSADSGELLERAVGGPLERVWLERSYHVATLDWDAPVVEGRVAAFAAQVLGTTGASR
jgi:carboxylesterase